MRCDVCGKFRKAGDVLICEESWVPGTVERWLECKLCLPAASVATYWPEES